MRRLVNWTGILVMGCAFALEAQQKEVPLPAPISMQPDRATDSYAIYSNLMPLGETASPDWPHALWLVKDITTTLVEPDQPCAPPPKDSKDRNFDLGMNPHGAIKPPEDRKADFAELLADFDVHCHERVTLDAEPWRVANPPVHLLSEAEQNEFVTTRGRTPYSGHGLCNSLVRRPVRRGLLDCPAT